MLNLNLLAMHIDLHGWTGLGMGIVFVFAGIYSVIKFLILHKKDNLVKGRVVGYKTGSDTKGKTIYFPIFNINKDGENIEISSETGEYSRKFDEGAECDLFYTPKSKTVLYAGDNKLITMGVLGVALGAFFLYSYFFG